MDFRATIPRHWVQQSGEQSQRSFPAQEGGSVFEDTNISDMLAGKAKAKAAGGGNQASRWVASLVLHQSERYRSFKNNFISNDDDAHFCPEERQWENGVSLEHLIDVENDSGEEGRLLLMAKLNSRLIVGHEVPCRLVPAPPSLSFLSAVITGNIQVLRVNVGIYNVRSQCATILPFRV